MNFELVKNQLSSAYNKQAKHRDSQIAQKWKITEREFFLHTLLKEKKQRLLEVGAGPGKDSLYFHNAGLDVHSTDLCAEMVHLCQNKGLTADVMSFDDLEFPNDSFEAIWALNCLLHVPKSNLAEVLLEIRRVLQPGGLFYLGVYGGVNHEGIWERDFHHPKRYFSFYDNEALKKAVSSVFTLEAFHLISKEEIGQGIHDFQGLLLRKARKG